MRKIILALTAASFSWLGDFDATAASTRWRGTWGHPSTVQYSHRNAAEAVRAPEEIAALRQLIDRAHAAGLKIYGATITPFEGSPDYTPEGEADRQAMNQFIRSGAFDGVVDFDAGLRDPARPTHLRADTESSGHLHPNDAGYRLMGDSIDLALFK